MSATTVETTRKVELERPRPTAVLIATDGTAQSDAAVAFAQLLLHDDKHEVTVLTVVDQHKRGARCEQGRRPE
jgi:hypothetical protein